ncbi:HAMP domain-containing sensor histidine kinase [Pseudomonas sp. N040]|uniref:HAMP domain-containing sensor histidine kinase n=1 Tax=Pseudomonas sp. N040 TaxID=2785325 RepID=UPI0018A31D83|nr:ATP-binding protein [Pseudomonas sp. N040]MBF7731234.1 HAMP domain-containing protein [Pseudomonas sp. N040]MBW7014877.1 HAMP domain-containing protein [Pseudomonas sp. N040]
MSQPAHPCPQHQRWHQRARQAVGHSIKLRLVLVFLLLALAVTATFTGGAQGMFSGSWRDAAGPLLSDYVDRVAADLSPGGSPSIDRARALTERLPVTVRISGAQINWQSHPQQRLPEWMHSEDSRHRWAGDERWQRLLTRTTADGHRLQFGIDEQAFEPNPYAFGITLGILLLLTLLAFLYVRRLLRPLDEIRAGAQRFGEGQFAEQIPVCHAERPDELGQLAQTINTMGHDIHQMLEAKRALLLAISHELRSPLTRARLNTELLPETAEVMPQRDALLRDLQEMASLISDLLESERLASRHAALHREAVDLPVLAGEVIRELQVKHAQAGSIQLQVAAGLPALALDPARMRLLLRNLLDNALRHSGDTAQPVELHIRQDQQALLIEVRDYGPGVPEEQLAQLAAPFFRPDAARGRTTGGVGLGLYLCRLVAEAHNGTFSLANARPGLRVSLSLPLH